MKKKLSVVTFAIAAVIGFSQLASAQSIQLQTQNAAAQGGVQTNGLGLSLGKPPVSVVVWCHKGAANIRNTWVNNGATDGQANNAAQEYFNNCMCAQYGDC